LPFLKSKPEPLMTVDTALADLAALAGIFPEFTDMQGVVRYTSPETARALLRASGLCVETPADLADAHKLLHAETTERLVPFDVVVPAGRGYSLSIKRPAEWIVEDEDTGHELAAGRAEVRITLPPLPMGVHVLRLVIKGTEQVSTLIAAPERAPSLDEVAGQERVWGCMAALYGLRSEQPKSMGDFNDLAELAWAFGSQGASFLGINPVHALGYAAEETISPYSPTHRGFLNTDHIAVEGLSVPPAGDLLDYAVHRKEHRMALRRVYETKTDNLAFEAFCAREEKHLTAFARFEVLSMSYGPDWRQWPDDLRAGGGDVKVSPDTLRYHKWLQWKADSQLAAAHQTARSSGMQLGLYLDLAVGARVGGAESWGQAAAAEGVSLGAPPDHLSPAGQNWQLTAFAPRKLQQQRYAALRHILRSAMRHCGLLRIDHALGLNRSYWIPDDGSPGGYIAQNMHALMAIIAIEAARSGTVIVGEDLGLVPAGFRETMAARGFYGYSVLQYEKDKTGAFLPADNLRARSLACFGTHDTPTLAGFWEGRDIGWWEKLGWITSDAAGKAMRRRMSEKRALTDVRPPAPLPKAATPGVRDTLHTHLATSPAALVAVQLDDMLLLKEAQNLPGTIDAHPNWRRRTPLTLREISASPDIGKTAAIMARAGRASKMRKDST
jgi:4-alpha-glucanotransferase